MVLEIEVQGARQVRDAMPEAVLIFIAPPDEEALRERLEGRGTDSPEDIEQRLRTAEIELGARSEFPLEVVNDEVQKAASELETLVGDELSLHDSHVNDHAKSRQASAHTDTHYAAALVAASSPPINAITTPFRGHTASTRCRWSRPSGNYLTIALEDTAAGS